MFMDSNGQLIDVQYVFSGSSATDVTSGLPSKPGYDIASPKWDKSLTGIAGDTIITLQYVRSSSSTYTVTVTSGTGGGSFAYGEVATVVADTPSESQYFNYWKIGDRVVSRQSTHSFTVAENTAIEAVYSSTANTDAPMISVSGDLALRSGYETYLGQFYIPSGFEYVEHGLLLSTTAGLVLNVDSASISRYQGSKYNPATNEFVMSITGTSWESVRAYLIVRDSQGNLMTVYDEQVSSATPSATDLILSEYIEGSSNNKALEIYNGTGSSISLANYTLVQYNNGSTSVSYSLALSSLGTLISGGTLVVYNSSSTASLISQAQTADLYLSTSVSLITFNGNDAIGLQKNGATIDLIGVIGSSTDYAKDVTLVRKSSVVSGVTTYDSSQWTSYSTDTFTYLGSHTMDSGEGKTAVSIEARIPTLSYAVDDSLSLTGAYLKVFYSDGSASIESLTSGMVFGFSSSSAGTRTMTITSGSLTDTLDYTVTAYSSEEDLHVYYIDIGATGGGPGESALIQYNGIDILVDSGENSTLANNALLDFLSAHVTDGTIEYIIATHQDSDHIGGFVAVMDAYVVENAILYSTPSSIATALRNTFEARVTSEGCTVEHVYDLATSSDPTIAVATGIDLRFYDTTYLTTANANYSSIVFVLEALGTRILFNGDAEQNQEAVYGPLVGDVDLFKMGHHGTANGTTTALLEAITPEVAVVTNGDFLGNEYGHPTYVAMSRIYQYSNLVPIYAVTGGNGNDSETPISWQRNGTITVTVSASGYSISSENYGSNPMEMSNTDYWNDATNSYSSYSYYYATSTGITDSAALKDALSLIIDGHTAYSYTAIIDILKVVDADPDVSGNVILFYTGRSQSGDGTYVGSTGNQDYWNREHIWAQSHGIDEALPGYTDLHHIRVADVSVNGARGDLDFANVAVHDATTLVGDASEYVDSSHYAYIGASTGKTGTYFEPCDELKGDVARMLFYMAVRYEGNNGEVDLELVNGVTTSDSVNIGDLATLLEWNELDPVSADEIRRNDLVFSYQGNRNPFIDHPELVELIFGNGD